MVRRQRHRGGDWMDRPVGEIMDDAMNPAVISKCWVDGDGDGDGGWRYQVYWLVS